MSSLVISSLGKRILSFFINVVCCLVASLVIYFPTNAIIKNQSFYQKSEDNYYQEYLLSNLYYEQDGKVISYLNDELNYSQYVLILENYYFSYLNQRYQTHYDNYWFNVHILHLEDVKKIYQDEDLSLSNIFVYDEENYEILGKYKNSNYSVGVFDESLDSIVKNALNSYFKNAYQEAITNFEDSAYLQDTLYRQYVISMLIAPLISLVISLIIFVLVIPLCDKYQRTIGKMVCHLVVIDAHGYQLNKGKLLIRQLFIIVVEVILGIATYFGFTLISYMFLMFSKKHQAVHDFIVKSLVVDDSSSWYANKKEYLSSLKEGNAYEEKSYY
jgi:uncharacterized RDD family membrane protein YckC